MRRMWAVSAAMLVCLALSGLQALAQEASDSPTTVPRAASQAVHVTGDVSNWAGTFSVPGSVAGAVTSDARLDGCYLAQPAGGTATGSWGTFTVFDGCGWVWPEESSVAMWEGGWFVADRAPDAVSILGDGLGTVWLDGLGENEGWSASLRIEGGVIDAWMFPTPETTAFPMPGTDGG